VRPKVDVPSRQDLRVFGGYCVAAVVYIAIGVQYLVFMLSVVVGMAYLLVAAWLVPLAFRRLRR
jgi:allophanate hydrolase subunit 1